eukprot:7932577-Pyramimonas_sp.AAC.1
MAIAHFAVPVVFCLVCGRYAQFAFRGLPATCPGRPPKSGGRANIRNRLLAGKHPRYSVFASESERYNTAEIQRQQRAQ